MTEQTPPEELRAWTILVRAPGINAERLRQALLNLPDAARLVSASPREMEQLGLPENARKYLAAACSSRPPEAGLIDADLAWLAAGAERRLVPLNSPDYPPLLAQTSGAPLALYVRGALGALQLPQLAIVGSRNPTASGRETAFAFARHLAGCGLAITSGLAEGIDAAAHRGALAANVATIAVCGTGLGERLSARSTRSSPSRSRRVARWCRSSLPTRRRAAKTFPSATASSAPSRSARWWSRRRARAAR